MNTSVVVPKGEGVSLAVLSDVRGYNVPAWVGGDGKIDPIQHCGDLTMLSSTTICVCGSRKASDRGLAWVRLLVKSLVKANITVLSGLARGIDVQAHLTAMALGGRTAAMLGTPIDRVYPPEHESLQALIGHEQLLLSPFSSGAPIRKGNFVTRNKVMAALCDGAVIVEANDKSGSLSFASACLRLQKPVFFPSWLVNRPGLLWPKKFVEHPGVILIDSPRDVARHLSGGAIAG